MSRADRSLAIIPWGNVIEDYLDPIDLSLEEFITQVESGWLFGMVDAMQLQGWRLTLVLISASDRAPFRCAHPRSGATIYLLPVPRSYRALRRLVRKPYARTVPGMFGKVRGRLLLAYPLLALIHAVLPYLATPLRPLGKILSEERCTAILCQEYEYPRFDIVSVLGRWLRIPVFAIFQGGNFQLSPLERFTRPRSIRSSAGLLIGPQAEVERVLARYKAPPGRIARVFNPLDLDFWKPAERAAARSELGISMDARVAVWHGRIAVKQKGLDVLLRAWQRVVAGQPGRDLRLLLIGAGQDEADLEERIAALHLPGVTRVAEYVVDRAAIRRYLSAADVYAFPSRHEGFPVAPLEAMACGLPLVATPAPGIADILEGGEQSGGIIVPVDDDVAFAEALGQLLIDDRRSDLLGKRARCRIESAFSLEAVGQQLSAFLLDPTRNVQSPA